MQAVVVGSGEHRYRVIENWAKLPDGWHLSDVASVAVDSKDRIYVFNRGAHPMLVLDREGNFLRSWGKACSNTRTACISTKTTISTVLITATIRFASAQLTERYS